MTKLSVNLNKFALIRNSRGRNYPDVLAMVQRCIDAGAHGITVHPRPDQRHARYADVYGLAKLIQKSPSIEFNVEGYPIEKFMEVVLDAKPDQCTLVPDAAGQLTSDHGWDMRREHPGLSDSITRLKDKGIRVSLFIDPNIEQIERAKEYGPDRIELYTEPYADTYGTEESGNILAAFAQAAARAQELGLGVNAGHDLNLENLSLFLRSVQGVLEVSIGHALVVESFDYTLEGTIERYLSIMREIQGNNGDT